VSLILGGKKIGNFSQKLVNSLGMSCFLMEVAEIACWVHGKTKDFSATRLAARTPGG
jgi:hypothetical protein